MEWNERTKTTDTRKTILTSLFIEIETGNKNSLQHFYFKYAKKLSYLAWKVSGI